MRDVLRLLLPCALAAACASTRAPVGARAHNEAAAEAAAMRSAPRAETRGDRADAAPRAVTDTGCGASSVYFETGSWELDDGDREQLQSLARCLESRDIDTLYVVGRTDPAGTDAFNLTLGQRRATAVADYLRATGLRTNFVIRSRGELGASGDQVLWPMERAAEAAAVTTPR